MFRITLKLEGKKISTKFYQSRKTYNVWMDKHSAKNPGYDTIGYQYLNNKWEVLEVRPANGM